MDCFIRTHSLNSRMHQCHIVPVLGPRLSKVGGKSFELPHILAVHSQIQTRRILILQRVWINYVMRFGCRARRPVGFAAVRRASLSGLWLGSLLRAAVEWSAAVAAACCAAQHLHLMCEAADVVTMSCSCSSFAELLSKFTVAKLIGHR